jgi:hypothetical protein
MKLSIPIFSRRLIVRHVALGLLLSILPLVFLYYFAVRASSEALLNTITHELKGKSFLVARDINLAETIDVTR